MASMTALQDAPSREQSAPFATHPLDPLTLDEIRLACDLVKAEVRISPRGRFPVVRLEEPGKDELCSHAGGATLPRLAFVVVLEGGTGSASEYIVDLSAKVIRHSRLLPNSQAPYGQPPVMIDEFMRCEAIVKADEGWRARDAPPRPDRSRHGNGADRSVFIRLL